MKLKASISCVVLSTEQTFKKTLFDTHIACSVYCMVKSADGTPQCPTGPLPSTAYRCPLYDHPPCHWRIQGAIRPWPPSKSSIVVGPRQVLRLTPVSHSWGLTLHVALKANLAQLPINKIGRMDISHLGFRPFFNC